jgi:thiamine transport system permease protein
LNKLRALWFLPITFLAVLFYWPLINITGLGLAGPSFWQGLEIRDLEITWFTIWQALLSTAATLVLAIPGAYVLYRKAFPGQRLFRSLITVPFMLPTVVVAIGFTIFRDSFGVLENPLIWIIVAHVFINYSLMVRTIGSFWLSLDHDVEEAAQVAGAGRLRIFWSITLPQLKPSVISATAATFLFCSASYGVILVLGGGSVKTLETEIANAANVFLDLERASLLALVQTVLSILAFAISQTGGRANFGIDTALHNGEMKELDARDAMPAITTAIVVLVLIATPMALIVLKTIESGDGLIGNFANLAGQGTRDLLNLTVFDAAVNSIRNMFIAGIIAVIVGTVATYLLAQNWRSKLSKVLIRVLDIGFLLPLGVSTVVLGFGYLITFGGGPLPLRESWLVVPIIQSVLAIPLVIRLVYPAIANIESSGLEAAESAGANRFQIWWLIQVPQIRPSLMTAAAFAALVSLGDFGASSLLAYGDQATLPTVLYALISKPGGENYGMAMAASTLLMALTFLVIFALGRETQREPKALRNARA